ncbi:MAG TPA: hypothetical protein DFI00_05055 [Rhodospirillaceae bacterium]|nr:hypothetical protein [Alphaproteobacteria bacterium]OUT39654.1 MAG: hypothetical protein CBB62_14940 [Micavibrio sp. TMED2]HCI46641.1 hypothetical protein [Rhodospirillaceae bacterium]MAS49048.1 hypothetical protein [Alphaproteobacteria bacterium]MAX97350.1 hypothetical protein [Alphaproteobacteria bacterium]|tara:strand:- start:3570 stop:5447 length:1878 start_codon:yes stop_codon:yes gene_type:complete
MAFTRPSPVRLVGLFLTAILVLLTLNYVRPALALDYTIRIDGLDDVDEEQAEEIRGLIRDTILLEQLRQDGAPSFFALERRAIADIDRINDVMRSRGFYASTIITEVEPDGPPVEDGGEPMPVAVIRLATGPLYTVGTVHVEQPGGGSVPGLGAGDLPISSGDPALSADVLEAEPVGIATLRSAGYALARSGQRRITVNHETRKLNVWYRYVPGPLVTYGDIRLDGLDTVAPVAVMRRLQFAKGDTFSPTGMRTTRSKILELEMFSNVAVELADIEDVPPDAETVQLPVQITVEERKSRTIGGGITLSTDQGFGIEGRWSHRNILGEAEKLDIVTHVGRIGAPDAQGFDYGVEADFRKFDFLRNDQTLYLNATAEVEAPEAYERQALEVSAALERPLFDDTRGRTGVTLAVEDIKDNDDTASKLFVTLAFPNSLSLDKTNDVLDPTEGYAIDLLLEPVLTLTDASQPYLISRVDGRHFWSLWEDDVAVLASRASFGSIFGASTDNIPANRRFFSGGDGSVRGYAHQAIGPKDSNNDPSGGRSLAELNLEMRIRITDTIGVVPFVDAGIVTDESFVDFSEDPRLGAGLGLRYYTGFGPLRVDFGVPINADDDDDAFQIYFSLGQAF